MLKTTSEIKLENKVAVIVARFQLHELHSEHKHLIDSVLARHSRVIIILGHAKIIGTQNNPLPVEARQQMIRESYPDVEISHLRDHKNDYVWSNNLDALISDLAGANQKAILYGSRDSFIKYYHGKLPVLELEAEKQISGTELRAAVAMKAIPSKDWRAGAIWQSYNRFPTLYTTVDAAIVSNDSKFVLLARKPAETKLRFVGGFAEPKSPSFEEDVLREVKEETTLTLKFPLYLGNYQIDDWRYRSGQDRIRTVFYFIKDDIEVLKTAKASDDLNGGEVVLKEFSLLKAEDFEEEHIVLFEALKKYLKGV